MVAMKAGNFSFVTRKVLTRPKQAAMIRTIITATGQGMDVLEQSQAKIMGKGAGIQVPDFYDNFCLVICGFCGKNRVVKILKEKPDGFCGFFSDIGVPRFVLDNVLIGNKIPDGLFVQLFDLLQFGTNQLVRCFRTAARKQQSQKEKKDIP